MKIKLPFGKPSEDICDLEHAKFRFDYGAQNLVMVEGQVVNSYEELLKLAGQDCYKEREFLEVVLLPQVAGG